LLRLLLLFVINPQRCGLTVVRGVEIFALLACGLGLLRLNGVSDSVWVMACTRNLPGDFAARLASSYCETIALDLLGNIEVWHWRPHGCELVVKIAVESFEIGRKLDSGAAAGIERYVTSVDLQHIRACHERLVEDLVGGVKRVIYAGS